MRKDDRRSYDKKERFQPINEAKNHLDDFSEPMIYVLTLTITITDKHTPEVPPIHRHAVLGTADSTTEAMMMLRAAIANAGFKSTQFDTRLGLKDKTVLYTRRQHTHGLIEDFEWVMEVVGINKYERE